MVVSANRLELLQIADAVAREKSIDKSIVIAAMADAIQKAARSRYGQETNIRADINPKTGEMKLQRLMEVVETVEDYGRQIALSSARERNPDAEVGDFIAEQLPPMDFGRIAAQSAKQVIVQKVREAERDRQFDEYKDRIGEIVNGTVKRVEYGNVIVDLGRGEAIIRRDELIPRENFKYGDRVRAYVYDVRREQRGPQIFLSRTHPQFMAKLFTMEVPEIYDGIIEIKSVARDPGSRAKIAVISRDSLDRSGRRLRRHARLARPGRRRRTAGREDRHHSVVAVGRLLHRQRAAAGGSRQGRARRGCRAHRGRGAGRPAVAGDRPPRPERPPRLAADRLGHRHPDRAGRDPSAARRNSSSARPCSWKRSTSTRWSARCWPRKASPRVEEVAYVDADEIASIDGFDEDTASEIQQRARDYLEKIEAEHDDKRKELGVADELREIPGVTTAMMVTLGEDGVKTIEDFAGYAVDDLVGWKERKDGETKFFPGVLASHSRVARRRRADGAGGAPQGRLDHRGRSRRRSRRARRSGLREVSRPGARLGRDERSHLHRHASAGRAG